jgi:hypothetical protein
MNQVSRGTRLDPSRPGVLWSRREFIQAAGAAAFVLAAGDGGLVAQRRPAQKMNLVLRQTCFDR